LKKKLILIPILVLALMASMGVPALAWDNVDPEINLNAQMDSGKTRGYSLADMLDNGQGNTQILPAEGDHIYVDVYSGSGDLAHLSILREDGVRVRKYSTEEIANADPGNTGIWKAYDGCMFYFAPEPRGSNEPDPEPDLTQAYLEIQQTHLQVFMPYGFADVSYNSSTLGELFVVGICNSQQYVVVIPAGTTVVDGNGLRPASLWIVIIDDIPVIFPSVTFSQPCTLYSIEGHLYKTQLGEWVGGTLVEVGTFTEG